MAERDEARVRGERAEKLGPHATTTTAPPRGHEAHGSPHSNGGRGQFLHGGGGSLPGSPGGSSSSLAAFIAASVAAFIAASVAASIAASIRPAVQRRNTR